MATQWTLVIAKHVIEQREGLRSKFNTLTSFELCMAVAAQLGRPLTIRPERLDPPDGCVLGASITIPEEHADTDADAVAAALSTPDTSSPPNPGPSLRCEHDRTVTTH